MIESTKSRTGCRRGACAWTSAVTALSPSSATTARRSSGSNGFETNRSAPPATASPSRWLQAESAITPRVGEVGVAPQRRDHVHPGEEREHEVDDDDVGPPRLGQLERLAPVARLDHLVLRLERDPHELAQVVVVLAHEHDELRRAGLACTPLNDGTSLDWVAEALSVACVGASVHPPRFRTIR